MEILIQLLNDGKVPSNQGNDHNAGYDIYSNEEVVIPAGERACIKTGVCISPPYGYYGHIQPRSGLAKNHGIATMAGIIDHGYLSEWVVILHNTDKNNAFKVNRYDRIAQVIFKKYSNVEWKVVDKLPESKRGAAGFGSSGSK